jgi:PAS domain S-box-containing protein
MSSLPDEQADARRMPMEDELRNSGKEALLQSRETIARQRDQIANILNSMVDGVYIANQQYDIEFVNRALETQFGAVEGRKCYQYLNDRKEVCPWCKNRAVFYEGKTVHWEWYSEKTGRTYDLMDTPLKNADGSVSKLEVFRDITERKQMEKQLRDSEERYRNLYEEAPNAYFSVGTDGRIERANRSAVELLGYSLDEMIGKPVLNLYADTPNGKARARRVFQRFLAGDDIRREEMEMCRVDGNRVWISLTVRPIRDKEGRVVASRSAVEDITERKQAEQALRENEQDLNRAQAVAHTGSWRMDVRRNQLLWSDETHRIFGIPRGTPMTYETFLSSIHPEDREHVDRKWMAALHGEPYDIEHRIIVDDEVKWVRERAELEFDSKGELKGGFGTVQDITERKLIENELRVKDFAVTSAASGIAIADLDGIVTYVNLACLSMWDYEQQEEVLGKHAINFFADKKRFGVALKTVLEEGMWQGEGKARRSDGSTFDVQVLANLVTDADGEPFCMMASFVDITERKKLDQLKDEFIGLVSHELRTPLTVIGGCLSTLLTEWNRLSPNEVQQLLKDALLESESLSHLIENLLELSRAQAQQLALYSEMIDIKGLVRETLSKIKRQAPSHRFVTSIPSEHMLIHADPLRIERILYNLLDNAAKYSPPGSQIKVSVNAEPERLVIGVSDHGKGLSSSEQARIFGPFQRLENKRPDQARGAGLGLMVCRRLVEAHGGEIWVESKKGRGSTFFFSLPRRKSTDAGRVSLKTAK